MSEAADASIPRHSASVGFLNANEITLLPTGVDIDVVVVGVVVAASAALLMCCYRLVTAAVVESLTVVVLIVMALVLLGVAPHPSL